MHGGHEDLVQILRFRSQRRRIGVNQRPRHKGGGRLGGARLAEENKNRERRPTRERGELPGDNDDKVTLVAQAQDFLEPFYALLRIDRDGAGNGCIPASRRKCTGTSSIIRQPSESISIARQ